MTWNELQTWVLKTQIPVKQVEMYVQEDVESEEDYIIEGVGPVFNAPFTGHTSKKYGDSNLHIFLWDYFHKYTWQQLVDWIDTIEDKNGEAIALCAGDALKLKSISEDRLYAYET